VANLISNAIKYSDSHTIIEIFTRLRQDTVEIEVKDHGAGIEKEKLAILFQPFSQAHFFPKAKGTGLGLYISKAILDQHEGKIWLESEVGQGTSAFFSLPIKNHKEVEENARVFN
jgi:signal transduction histidine kinase